MIFATAGHVDHGKTTLVRALTGVDTDRLPEEKRRGMSIDLGFAYFAASEGGEPIGLVDVPGHEGFIRNALAGLAGVDRALLVVAADDGAMPQTLEHLAMLALLEVPLAAVVVTKIDRVSPQRVEEVAASVAQLLHAQGVPEVPLFRVAAPQGEGVAPLLAHLVRQAQEGPRASRGQFRLAVDRAFSVTGAGLVVTGTVVSGCIEAGATVQLLSSGATGKVRGLHAQHRAAAACRAGERAALNLSGGFPHAGAIARGDWLVAGDPPAPQGRIDVLLRLPPGASAALKHRTAVHVHLAAAHATGRLALLEDAVLEPGATALAQLVLDAPLGAVAGDRFVVRDAAAQRTLAGGRVLDVFPPARGRARPQRLGELRQLARDDAKESLHGLLAACPGGVALEPFRRNRNLTQDEAAALFATLAGPCLATAQGPLAFAQAHWEAIRSAALANVAAWHARESAHAGPPADRILPGAGLPRDSVLAIAAQLVREGTLARRGMGVALPGHAPRLAPADEGLWGQVRPLLAEGGRRPPSVAEVAYALRAEPRRVDAMLAQAAHCGHVLRVSARHYFLPAAVLELAQAAHALATEHAGGFTAAAYRDRCGIGRNLSIEVLEFFDHVKYTRRVGDRHVLLAAPGEVFDTGAHG